MADYVPFPPFSSSPFPPLGNQGRLALPVLIGCAGRCGKVAAIHWPCDPTLGDLVAELRKQQWVLATAELAGVSSIIGNYPDAVAPICSVCAAGEVARARLSPGRVPTLRR